MKKLMLIAALIVNCLFASASTPKTTLVRFDTYSFFGTVQSANVVLSPVTNWITDGTNMFYSRSLTISNWVNGSAIVPLIPNDYAVTVQGLSLTKTLHVPPVDGTNVILAVTNMSVLQTYCWTNPVGPWDQSLAATSNYLAAAIDATNTVLTNAIAAATNALFADTTNRIAIACEANATNIVGLNQALSGQGSAITNAFTGAIATSGSAITNAYSLALEAQGVGQTNHTLTMGDALTNAVVLRNSGGATNLALHGETALRSVSDVDGSKVMSIYRRDGTYAITTTDTGAMDFYDLANTATVAIGMHGGQYESFLGPAYLLIRDPGLEYPAFIASSNGLAMSSPVSGAQTVTIPSATGDATFAGSIVASGASSSLTFGAPGFGLMTGDSRYTVTTTNGTLCVAPEINTNIDIANGLWGWWKFENNLLDSSGNGHTLSGSTFTYSAGHNGAADLCVGKLSQALTYFTAQTAPTNTWSCSGWFKFSGSTVTPQGLFSVGGSQSAGPCIYADKSGSNYVLKVNDATNAANIGVTVATNVWFHLAVIRQLGLVKMFVNGVQYTGVTITTNISHTGYLEVGGNGSFSEHFYGWMDDVRYYTRALSTAEAQYLYQTPPTIVAVSADISTGALQQPTAFWSANASAMASALSPVVTPQASNISGILAVTNGGTGMTNNGALLRSTNMLALTVGSTNDILAMSGILGTNIVSLADFTNHALTISYMVYSTNGTGTSIAMTNTLWLGTNLLATAALPGATSPSVRTVTIQGAGPDVGNLWVISRRPWGASPACDIVTNTVWTGTSALHLDVTCGAAACCTVTAKWD